MIWTEAADRLLIRLWNSGGNLRSIADAMAAEGYDVTRNSVAGRKHRLTYDQLSGELFHRQSRGRPQQSKPRGSMSKPKQEAAPPVLKSKPLVRDPVYRGPKIEYLESREYHCKAIMEERAGTWDLPMVCGSVRLSDDYGRSSYCAHHHALYNNPNTKRA